MIWCHLLFWCHHPSLSSSSICQHSGVKRSLRGIDESKYKYNHAPVPYRHPPTRYRANGKYPHPFGHMLQWPESGRSTPNTGWLGPPPSESEAGKGGGLTQAPSFLLRISPNGPRLPEAADGAGDLLSSVSERKSHNKNKDAPAGFGVGGWVWEWLFHSCSCLYCSLLGMISRRRQGSHVSGVSFPSFP